MYRTIFVAAFLISQAAFAYEGRANRDPANDVLDPVIAQEQHGKQIGADLADIADSPVTVTIPVQGHGDDSATKITN